MKIKIEEINDYQFSADITDLPGSPMMGFGTTREAAIAEVLVIHAEEITRMKDEDRYKIEFIKDEK